VVAVKNSSDRRIIPAAEVQSETIIDFTPGDFKDPSYNQANNRPKPKPRQQEPQLTAADLEKIQKEAYDEAYEQGRKEGFEFGHKEAQEQFREKFSEKLKSIENIIKVFEKPFDDLDEQVEQEITSLIISMVKQLVRREIRMEPSHVIGVVREALAILPVASRDISVMLNPADAELIREAYSLGDREESWRIVEQPTLARGGCRIQAQDSVVDATLESRLDAMIAPLLNDERSSESEARPVAGKDRADD
jgi:flagellar assembly protein FliH